MMSKFTEAKIENLFIEMLEQEGYPHCLGIAIKRKPDKVLLEEDLRVFLLIALFYMQDWLMGLFSKKTPL